VHEVLDRAPLLEELGVRHIPDVLAAAPDRAAGAHRHRALHDERVLVRVAQVAQDGLDAREVRVPRVGRRRVHAHEQELSPLEHVGHVGREVEPLGVLADELGQPGLVDRDLAARERLDLLGHDVARPHLVAELGEAGGRDETHPSGADDTYRFPVHAAGEAI
jgi:hypothetical protein